MGAGAGAATTSVIRGTDPGLVATYGFHPESSWVSFLLGSLSSECWLG